MIVILKPDTNKETSGYTELLDYLHELPNIHINTHDEYGTQQVLTELYLIGETAALNREMIESFEVVDRVVRVSREYRILGRHGDDQRASHFDYNGVTFGQDNLHVMAGLCAVDTREHLEMMMLALNE